MSGGGISKGLGGKEKSVEIKKRGLGNGIGVKGGSPEGLPSTNAVKIRESIPLPRRWGVMG